MKNIVENNKVFAEFLGYSQPHPDYPNTTYWYKKDCQPLTILLFHSDWNWLMRVVEKIESLNLGNTTIKTVFSEEDLYINSNVSFLIMYKECYVNFFGEMKVYENWISVTECNSKIEAVYTACVEFIKWYNELNKSYEKS